MILAACLSALLAGQTVDIVSTVRLLQRPGYAEGNPLLPSHPVGIVAVKAAVTTGLVGIGWSMRKRHPKAAALVFVAGAVSGSLGAWHNARVERRQR
jgi:hypothetical protein